MLLANLWISPVTVMRLVPQLSHTVIVLISGSPRIRAVDNACRLCAGRRWLTLVVGNAQNIPF